MLRINERVLDLVRFTELSAILGSRPSSRDFFLEILSSLLRAWEEGERMEGWGGGTAWPNGQHVALAIHVGGPGF